MTIKTMLAIIFGSWATLWAAIVLAVMLSACAEIPCAAGTCTPGQLEAERRDVIEPLDYDAIFGKRYVVHVFVDDQPADPNEAARAPAPRP